MKKEDIENLVGHFTWSFSNKFFIETSVGNFEWSDPSYPGGTNEIIKFDHSYNEWVKYMNIPFGRDKGKHIIKDYCKNFIFVENQ